MLSSLFSLQLRARDDDCVPPGTDVRGGEAIQVWAGGDLKLVMMLMMIVLMLIMIVLMLIMIVLMLIMIMLMLIMTLVSPSSGSTPIQKRKKRYKVKSQNLIKPRQHSYSIVKVLNSASEMKILQYVTDL